MKAAALLLSLALAVAPGCRREGEEGGGTDAPAVLARVGPFSLIERSGATVTREDLQGRSWVASFLFTRCTGPCPKVAGTLRKLQARLDGGPVRIVTFTVDSLFDTPEVLARYAEDLGAERERWLFLTGEEGAIHALIRESFLSAAARAPEGTAPIGLHVTHGTRLFAVDPSGAVRGYVEGETDAQLDRLLDLLGRIEGPAR